MIGTFVLGSTFSSAGATFVVDALYAFRREHPKGALDDRRGHAGAMMLFEDGHYVEVVVSYAGDLLEEKGVKVARRACKS